MPIKKRFVRNPKKKNNDDKLLVFEGSEDDHKTSNEEWIAAPVKKGSLVLIHGQVLHKSEANFSSNPRHAYTFHMVETNGSAYSPMNWLQPTESLPFPKLFA